MNYQNKKIPRVINTPNRVKMYADLERKICSKCSDLKDLVAFSKRSARPSGKASWCKECLNEWRRNHRKKHAEKFKAYEFKRGLRRNYGMVIEDYNQRYRQQDGKCACCGTLESRFERKLHVDHDHTTGAIRGLLCTKCNPGMGYFDHSIEKLMRAIAYLEKFKN